MQDIADWLKKLGMSEYTRRFAEDRIDFSVLPKLTDQHLKDLGVALGDRLKMLAAIRELGISIPASPHPAETGPNGQDTGNPPLPSIPAAATPLSISAAAEAAGERRYLTVMFCDLVGSTSLAAKLDAEDWRNLVSAYLDEASAAVTGLGGHVLKKARRRADGAVRLSAARRRTTPSAQCAPRSQSNARSPTSTQECSHRRARAFRPHRP